MIREHKPQNTTETAVNYDRLLSAGFRYVVNISFKQDISFMAKRIENIAEPVKTLKEAQEYKSLIDNTVERACIVDRVTNKVVEWWVS